MEVQSLSQTNSPYFSGNIKLPKSHIERIKAFTQRSTLAPQKDILILNGSSMQGGFPPIKDENAIKLSLLERIWYNITGKLPPHIEKQAQANQALNDISKTLSNQVTPNVNHILSSNTNVTYNQEIVNKMLKQLEETGELTLKPNSIEAVNFALFQDELLTSGIIKEPIMNIDELFNIDHLDTLGDLLPQFFDNEKIQFVINRIKGVIKTLSEIH